MLFYSKRRRHEDFETGEALASDGVAPTRAVSVCVHSRQLSPVLMTVLEACHREGSRVERMSQPVPTSRGAHPCLRVTDLIEHPYWHVAESISHEAVETSLRAHIGAVE